MQTGWNTAALFFLKKNHGGTNKNVDDESKYAVNQLFMRYNITNLNGFELDNGLLPHEQNNKTEDVLFLKEIVLIEWNSGVTTANKNELDKADDDC